MRFLLLGLLCLFVAACQPPTEVEEGTNPTEATEAADSGGDAAALNTPVDTHPDRQVTVTGAETVDVLKTGNQFAESIEAKGGKLSVVYLTLKNTGSESGNMLFTVFEVVDGQGRSYKDVSSDADSMMALGLWEEAKGLDSSTSDIFPGGEVNVAKVFRVAPDAEGLQLKVNNKLFALE